jgi:hypothetical protein
MADTTIIEREVAAVQADVALTPFSWGAAIAGALAATAVALVIIALSACPLPLRIPDRRLPV